MKKSIAPIFRIRTYSSFAFFPGSIFGLFSVRLASRPYTCVRNGFKNYPKGVTIIFAHRRQSSLPILLMSSGARSHFHLFGIDALFLRRSPPSIEESPSLSYISFVRFFGIRAIYGNFIRYQLRLDRKQSELIWLLSRI